MSQALFCLGVLVLCAAVRKFPLLYGVALNLVMFCVGAGLSSWKASQVGCPWPSGKRVYTAVVTDYPRERARSWLLKLQITGAADARECVGQTVWLYVPSDTLLDSLEPGKVIAFRGRVEAPDNEGIEDGFDYAGYLHRNGVAGTLWVPSADWTVADMPVPDRLSWRSRRIRHLLLGFYEEWPFTPAARALVSAVTLGSKDLIDDETRLSFSASGASHVLAVSGLHVGIIYAVLGFLFPPFMNVGRRKWVKESLVMAALWAYAYMIGMPLSITRSLIMFLIISFCRCCGRESSSLNSLALAAILILAADPAGLYETGFQLSFSAVFFIVLLQPHINELLNPENRIVRYFWDIVTVSLAAQIGTAPIVLYSFGTFSTYFLVTNMVALPLMFLTVLFSMLLWMVAPVPLLRLGVVYVLNLLCSVLQKALAGITSLPHSVLNVSVDSLLPVVTAYVVILLLYGYVASRRSRFAVAAVGVLSAQTLLGAILVVKSVAALPLFS